MNLQTHIGHRGRTRLTLTVALVGLTVGLLATQIPHTSAEPRATSEKDRHTITLAVSHYLQSLHLSRHPLDDEMSRRCLTSYVKSLDPRKLYFYEADIHEFMAYRNDIDDKMKQGDIQLAHQILDRFLKRVDERRELVDQILDSPLDFTVEEEFVTDSDLLAYPKNDVEMRDRWVKRIKYDLLVRKTDDMTEEKALEKARRRYHSIARRWHQTDINELLELYLSAMTTGFDPHSTYMSPDTLANFEIAMRLKLEGIGASLQQEDGYTVVKKIISGGAADKQGELTVEDQIVSVGQGTEGEMADVVDMKLTDVVKQIRGKKGTIVRLGVIPSDSAEEKIYTITREQIKLKDSEARSEVIELSAKADGQPFRVGVIVLPSFYMDMEAARTGSRNFKSSSRDVRRLLIDLREQAIDAVIFDLRTNGGGALIEAVAITGLFIDEGPVVQVKSPNGQIRPHPDTEKGMQWSGPLVVLVSKFSASASEIFAGASQDYHRGIIVGDKSTHGKGTVQQVFDLGEKLFRAGPNSPDYGALKLTIQQFYRPNGESTQNRGVLSDIELPSLTTHWPYGESDSDHALAFDQVKPLPHDTNDLVNEGLVGALIARSALRIAESEEFSKVAAKIKRYLERKERKTMPLNREKFLAERAELDNEKEQREQAEDLTRSDEAIVKRDYYFNEALAITQDYVNLLEHNKVAKTNVTATATP